MAGGRLWELDEDARVRAAPRGGLRDLACELGRTYGAVKQRARSAPLTGKRQGSPRSAASGRQPVNLIRLWVATTTT